MVLKSRKTELEIVLRDTEAAQIVPGARFGGETRNTWFHRSQCYSYIEKYKNMFKIFQVL